MSQPSQPTIVYTDVNSVVTELNLVPDPNIPTNYYLWQISTPVGVVANYVSEANQYTTALYGDLSTNVNLFTLAHAYATKWASLRLVTQMAINWQISGMKFQAGNISIDRLNAMVAALQELKQRLETDLIKYYILLSDYTQSGVNSYKSPSPYVESGGSLIWY
jgi:hypothetical protein